jgi:general secretion pathway protein G
MRRARGYSMVELLAVLAILSVLAWLVMPLATLARERARERELQQALWQIREAIDAYKKASDNSSTMRDPNLSGYPPTLLSLSQGLVDVKTGQVTYFLRRVPRDPFAPPELAPEQTWGLRSFQSPPDAPAPGADVYDVYSKAPGDGLNGVPFRAW